MTASNVLSTSSCRAITPAAGAQRCAHRDFSSASQRAGELQIRNIRAGDQQHAHHSGKQQIQAGAIIADCGFKQRPHRHSPTRVGLRIFFVQIDGDCIQIAHRLRDRHTRFQPAKARPTLVIVALSHPRFLCDFAERKQHIRIPAELKFSWEHADDLALQSID